MACAPDSQPPVTPGTEHTSSAPFGAGLIIRQREPVNLESPFDLLDGRLTPNPLFYVRSHFKAPALQADSWRLEIGGAVHTPLSLSLDDLLSLPTVTQTATLECAGNGRVFLIPQAEGAQWELGAVSTAEWTGVPLTTILERAGLHDDVLELVLEGADQGTPKEAPVPPGEIRYARSFPRAKAADVLLAFRMNGDPLARDHGFPVRAVVPGWYGMASVKWLTRIWAVRDPFRGYFQTSDYAFWDYVDGQPVRVPLGPMQLKSAIARPRVREVVRAGQSYTVAGAAWGGSSPLARIELSTDDGLTWTEAHWLDEDDGPAQPGIWRRWQHTWPVPAQPGWHTLRSRVWNTAGQTQPTEHDKRFGNYVIHHTFAIEVQAQ